MPLIPVKDKATPSNRLKKLTTNYLDRIVNINMIAHKICRALLARKDWGCLRADQTYYKRILPF